MAQRCEMTCLRSHSWPGTIRMPGLVSSLNWETSILSDLDTSVIVALSPPLPLFIQFLQSRVIPVLEALSTVTKQTSAQETVILTPWLGVELLSQLLPPKTFTECWLCACHAHSSSLLPACWPLWAGRAWQQSPPDELEEDLCLHYPVNFVFILDIKQWHKSCQH
jgi:hypothetical protein